MDDRTRYLLDLRLQEQAADDLRLQKQAADDLRLQEQAADDRAVTIAAAILIVADRLATLDERLLPRFYPGNDEAVTSDPLTLEQAADQAAALLAHERARHA